MLSIFAFYRSRLFLLLFILSFSLTLGLYLGDIFHIPLGFMEPKSETYQARLEKIPPQALEINNRRMVGNVQKIVLSNGLTVLTREVHSAPVVTVQVWYNVGSSQDSSGMSGIAHQLEHIMFKGTKKRPIQFSKIFNRLGSNSNAFTSYEQTAYYHTVYKNQLQALLELEADRMANLLIDSQDLASEKQVVISELEGYENRPKYRLKRAVMRSIFPHHGYGLPTGGTKSDVVNLTVEQIREHYEKHYHPNHAILVIVGDFTTSKTLQTVKEIFGKIPPSQQLPSFPPSPVFQPSSSPIILREPGGRKLLQVIYPLPDLHHPDIPALGVMDYILTGGKNSHLYQTLVSSGLVTDLSARVVSLRQGGWYDLSVIPAPNQDLQTVYSTIKSAITKLVQTGIKNQDIERAKRQIMASVIFNRQDITSQAMQLANDQLIANDYEYTEKYLEGVSRVNTTQVIDITKKYLTRSAVIGFFVPDQNTSNSSYQTPGVKTEELLEKVPLEHLNSREQVSDAEVIKYLPSSNNSEIPIVGAIIPQKLKLNNGLKVLLLADRSIPTITVAGYIQGGKEFDQAQKAGLASLVADSLMNGTTTQSMSVIAETLDSRGASLEFTAFREGVRLLGKSLREDLAILLHTVADVVKNSNFPAKELEISRQKAITELQLDLQDADEVANRKFIQALYPSNHPLHIFPTLESIQKISREDTLNFRQIHYRPDNMILAIVGDFELARVKSLLEMEFANWRVGGKAPAVQYPQVARKKRGLQINYPLPGKSQPVTYMGNLGVKRQDPRFYSALVLNQILTGDTVSGRLSSRIRDELGLTYGIYSNFQGGKNSGTFIIEIQTSSQHTEQAIFKTREILQDIYQTGVTNEEVAVAKHSLVSGYNLSLAKPQELTTKILMNEFFGLEQVELQTFPSKIQKVTRDQVNQLARQILNPDQLTVVTTGDIKSLSQ